MTEADFFQTLSANGPWAAVAGLLLWQVIKAWSSDRQTLTTLLSEFRGSIDALRVAVERLSEHVTGASSGRKGD
jgi:hypothetical protein